MQMKQEVIDRLLVAKDLLGRIRFLPITRPDRVTLAMYILSSHDAAELTFAAIASHINVLPDRNKSYLMDYISAFKQKYPNGEVPGRDFFSQLNSVRVNIKHQGIFPDYKQWCHVGERTYDYLSECTEKYMKILFDDLDESALLADENVKSLYDEARISFEQDNYKATLEKIGQAFYMLFESNKALRNLHVGDPRAEDAIKLSAFGINSNDFLALQEFLPAVYKDLKSNPKIVWHQEKFGHPANWNENSADFCLRTFLHVAIRIQEAEWIPGAIEFSTLYEHKITAIADEVEIVQEPPQYLVDPGERKVVRILKKGESLRGLVSKPSELSSMLYLNRKKKDVVTFINLEEKLSGDIETDKVKITCVPKEHPVIKEYFPDLPVIEYDPSQ